MRPRVRSDEEHVPEAPQVGHDGHGEYDHTFDRNGNVIDVASDAKHGGHDEKENRGRHNAGHVGTQICVLIHKTSYPHKWYSNAGITPGKRTRAALSSAARAQSNQGTPAGCSRSSFFNIWGQRSR